MRKHETAELELPKCLVFSANDGGLRDARVFG